MGRNFIISIEPQECNDIGYVFTNIPMVITRNLLVKLKQMGANPQEVIFCAHMQLLEKYGNENIDYLQVFNCFINCKPLTFWCISNKMKNFNYGTIDHNNEFNICFLLPEDY